VLNKTVLNNTGIFSFVNYYGEYGDIEEAYEHYGLAYSYIYENNDINNI